MVLVFLPPWRLSPRHHLGTAHLCISALLLTSRMRFPCGYSAYFHSPLSTATGAQAILKIYSLPSFQINAFGLLHQWPGH